MYGLQVSIRGSLLRKWEYHCAPLIWLNTGIGIYVQSPWAENIAKITKIGKIGILNLHGGLQGRNIAIKNLQKVGLALAAAL